MTYRIKDFFFFFSVYQHFAYNLSEYSVNQNHLTNPLLLMQFDQQPKGSSFGAETPITPCLWGGENGNGNSSVPALSSFVPALLLIINSGVMMRRMRGGLKPRKSSRWLHQVTKSGGAGQRESNPKNPDHKSAGQGASDCSEFQAQQTLGSGLCVERRSFSQPSRGWENN